MIVTAAYYFCCLNPTERSVFRATAEALALTLFLGVPLDLWQSFWLLETYSGAARRAAFLAIYGLEIVTIETGDPVELVEVVRPTDLPMWVENSLFILTPAAACLAGCEQSRPPYAT